MEWEFGKAGAADFDRINALFVEMLQAVYQTDRVTGYRAGDLDRYFAGGADWICTATVNGTIIAFLSIEVHRGARNCIYLDDLSVTARYRDRGIGTALIERAEAYGRELRLPCVDLHAERSNPAALRLYAKLGYSVCEEQGTRYLLRKAL